MIIYWFSISSTDIHIDDNLDQLEDKHSHNSDRQSQSTLPAESQVVSPTTDPSEIDNHSASVSKGTNAFLHIQ